MRAASEGRVVTVIILFILTIVMITGFLTPQYVVIVSIATSVFAAVRLSKFPEIHLRIRRLLRHALIVSIMLSAVSIMLFTSAIERPSPQFVSLTLITSYIVPIPSLTVLCIMLTRYVLRYKFVVVFALILYAMGMAYLPVEVSSSPTLLNEIKSSNGGLLAVISGEVGMMMSFSAPLSLSLMIISVLLILIILIKSLITFLQETS